MPENNNNGGKHTIEEVLAMHAAQEEKNNQTSQGAVSPADRVNKNAPKNVETEPVEEEAAAFDEQQVSRHGYGLSNGLHQDILNDHLV